MSFLMLTYYGEKKPVLINLEHVTRIDPIDKGDGAELSFVDGARIAVNEDFARIKELTGARP